MSEPKYTVDESGNEGVEAMRALHKRTVEALEEFDDSGKMSFLTFLIREVATGVARRYDRDLDHLVMTLALRVLHRVR